MFFVIGLFLTVALHQYLKNASTLINHGFFRGKQLTVNSLFPILEVNFFKQIAIFEDYFIIFKIVKLESVEL